MFFFCFLFFCFDVFYLKLECTSDYTPGPTSSPIEDGTFGPFDCNVGVYETWPLVDGECSYGDSSSYMVECADDGDTATLYEYSGTTCSGDTVNETLLELFYCGSSSSCTMTTMSADVYNTSGNCSIGSDDEVAGSLQLNLAQMDTCIELFEGLLYMGIVVDDDSVTVSGYFLDNTCSSNTEFELSFEEGCTQVGDQQSLDASFSTSTVNSDGPSSGGSDIAPNRFGSENIKQIFTFIGTTLTIVALKSF